jgi:glycosyltransferase involved in cell wall biosynthesis
MNLLIVCKALPDSFKGGIQTHVADLSRSLVEMGHKVTLLTAGTYRSKGKTEIPEGIEVIRLPYLPGKCFPVIRNTIEEFSFNLTVRFWLNKHAQKYDLIHLQGRSGLLFGKRGHTPHILTLHRMLEVEARWSKKEYPNILDRMLHLNLTRYFERKSLKKADAIIAISEEVVREIQTVNPKLLNKTQLIYNGISPQSQDENMAYCPSRLLFVGRLTEIKGLQSLIEAIQWVDPKLELVIIGDGPLRPELERQISQMGLEKRIKLLGSRNRKDVLQWMRASFSLILPSFHESLGIVLLETNSCGRPILASNVEGIREVVTHGQNGYLFPAGQPLEMARMINRLLDSPEEAQKMGQWGKQFVLDKFNWEKITTKTLSLYRSVL